jgi:mRNA interferase MazF
MRSIVVARLDNARPVLVLTRATKLPLVTWVTIAPITTTIRELASEVPVGPRNGLDAPSVVSCDTITTVRQQVLGDTIGVFFDDQEPELARAISDAFDLSLY